MDILLVKQQKVWAHCFHPEKQHIFYLVESEQTKGLVIIEEELINKSQINTFLVPKGSNKNNFSSGYILNYCRKQQILVLSYPPNNLCIWNAQNKELLLSVECHGKKPYKINTFAISELFSCFFFSAHGQRNLYYFNIRLAIQLGYVQQYGKLKFPKKIHIFDMQTHPKDPRIACACSDGHIRIWNYDQMISLKSLHEPDYNKNQHNIEGVAESYFVCMNISNDGSKLLAGTNKGKIYCWDGRTIGSKNILLAQIRVSERGLLSLNFFNYNGDLNSDQFICYNSEGNIKLLQIKLFNTMNKIRERQSNISGGDEKFGKITEIQSLQHTQTEVQNYVDLCVSKLLQTHSYNNMLSYMIVKSRQMQDGQALYQFQVKLFQMQDKNNPQSEYPVLSEQYPHTFQSLIPDQDSRGVLFQDKVFFMENYEIKNFSMAQGLLQTTLNLQQPLQCEQLKFNFLQVRPLTLKYQEEGKFLACFKSDGNQRMCCVRSKIDNNKDNQILSFKEIPCQQSFFLGNISLKNPPVFLLMESRMGYQIYIDQEMELDPELKEILQEKGNIQNQLNYKVQRVYSTPIRQGFVVVYQTANENVLRLSKNHDEEVDLLDFTIDSNINCRLDSQETIVDVQCNMVKKDICILAVICTNKVFFLDGQLRIINKFKILNGQSTNMIVQGKWFGPCLLLMTKTHLHYLTIQGDSQALISSDNINSRQVVGMTMIDRILIMSKDNIQQQQSQQQQNNNNSKQQNNNNSIDIKIKGFSILEPLILGYLSLCQYFEEKVDELNVNRIIECYKTNRISQKLIDGLRDFNLNLQAHYLMMQDETRQFPAQSKIKICKILGKMDNFMEIIFPGKNLDDSGTYIDLVNKLILDPRFVAKRKLLQNLENYFLNIGDYQNMVQVSAMLGNFDKIIFIAKLTKNTELENQIKEKVFSSPQGKQYHNLYKYAYTREKETLNNPIEKFSSSVKLIPRQKDIIFNKEKFNKNILQNISLLDILQEQYGSQKLQKLQDKLKELKKQKELNFQEIGFGEDLFTQLYYDKNTKKEDDDEDEDDEDDQENENQNKQGGTLEKCGALVLENLEQYVGIETEFREANLVQANSQQQQQSQQTKDLQDNNNENNMMIDNNFDNNFNEDEDEYKNLIVYWRFDQGKGLQVNDISNYDNLGKLIVQQEENQQKIWQLNEEGEPMELEDNYGEKVPKQYSIDCKYCYIQSEKIKQLKSKVKEFTFEIWLNPKEKNNKKQSSILQIKKFNNNEDSPTLNLYVKENLEVGLQFQQQEIIFKFLNNNKNEEDQQEEQMSKFLLKENVWNHISMVYDLNLQKFNLYYMGKHTFQSEESIQFQDNIFKDHQICLGQNFQGYLTEFRFRKDKQSIHEIFDQYRTPLEKVAQKIKEFKVRFTNEKKQQKSNVNINSFKFGDIEGDNNQNKNKEQVIEQKKKPINQFAFSNPDASPPPEKETQEEKQQENKQDSKQQQQGLNQFQFSLPPECQDGNNDKEQGNNDDDDGNKQQTKKQKQESKQQQKQQQGLNQFQFALPPECQDDDNQDNEDKEEEQKNNTEEENNNQQQQQQSGLSTFQFQLPPECEQQDQEKEQEQDIQQDEDQLEGDTEAKNSKEQQQQHNDFGGFDNFANNNNNNNDNSLDPQQQNQLGKQTSINNFQDFGTGWGNFGSGNNIEDTKAQQQKEKDQQDWGFSSSTTTTTTNNTTQQQTHNQQEQQEQEQQQQQSNFDNWGTFDTNNNNTSSKNTTQQTNENEDQNLSSNNTTAKNIETEQVKIGADQQQQNQQLQQQQQVRAKTNTINDVIEAEKAQLVDELFSGFEHQENDDHKLQENLSQHYDHNKSIDNLDHNNDDLQQQEQEEKQEEKQQQNKHKKERLENMSKEEKMEFIQQNQKNIQKELHQLDLQIKQKQYSQGIQTVGHIFQSITDILHVSRNQLYNQLQKMIQFCSLYRFALQLRVQVNQLKENPSKIKKEIFMLSILINLPLKPPHRIQFILEAINRNIEAQNFLLAHTLIKGIHNTFEKMKASLDQEIVDEFQKVYELLENKEEKTNQSIERIMCPYCLKSFHFRGNKQCNKCQKNFEFCSQTLQPVPIRDLRVCGSCKILYGAKSKKIGDQCSICKLGKIQLYIEKQQQKQQQQQQQ